MLFIFMVAVVIFWAMVLAIYIQKNVKEEERAFKDYQQQLMVKHLERANDTSKRRSL